MPFQALPIALRANTGDPLTKLLWVEIVHHARLTDAPNGKAFAKLYPAQSAEFGQCSVTEVVVGWERLERLGLVQIMSRPALDTGDDWFLDVNLPMSQLLPEERKRVKASPDQLDLVVSRARFICAGCGEENVSLEGWHVDHIIPRAVGGADVEDNLQPLCDTCNARKHARVHWVDFLGGRR
jgi:hypothetical protein